MPHGFSSDRRPLASRLALVILSLALAACERVPESSPMPVQRPAPDASDPNSFLVRFSDHDANEYVVRDIQQNGNWAFDHPEMKFPIQARAGLRFTMQFSIPTDTFKDTGPVTVTVKINDHQLGSERCEHAGSYIFERPIPLDWLPSGEPVHVLAEATPLWTAEDGAHLGYLLEEAGFHW